MQSDFNLAHEFFILIKFIYIELQCGKDHRKNPRHFF